MKWFYLEITFKVGAVCSNLRSLKSFLSSLRVMSNPTMQKNAVAMACTTRILLEAGFLLRVSLVTSSVTISYILLPSRGSLMTGSGKSISGPSGLVWSIKTPIWSDLNELHEHLIYNSSALSSDRHSDESHTFLAGWYAIHTVWFDLNLIGSTEKVALVMLTSWPRSYLSPGPFSYIVTLSLPFEYGRLVFYLMNKLPWLIAYTCKHNCHGLVGNHSYIVYVL